MVTVQVGSQVSGTIEKLFVNFNSKVKSGQVVAELNQDKFRATVDQAKPIRSRHSRRGEIQGQRGGRAAHPRPSP